MHRYDRQRTRDAWQNRSGFIHDQTFIPKIEERHEGLTGISRSEERAWRSPKCCRNRQDRSRV